MFVQNGQNRQSFVDIFFVFSVVIIIIGNFFLLNAISAENNTISRNHVRATQLVQERVQIMLSIQKQKKDKRVIIDGHSYNWSELFDKAVTFLPCVSPLDPSSNCSDFILSECLTETNVVGSRCVIRSKTFQSTDSWKIKQDIAPFSQKIRLSDSGTNAKKITVLIWWTDSLGLHKSVISRTLEK